MGGGDCIDHQNTICLEPASALNADDRIIQLRSLVLLLVVKGSIQGGLCMNDFQNSVTIFPVCSDIQPPEEPKSSLKGLI